MDPSRYWNLTKGELIIRIADLEREKDKLEDVATVLIIIILALVAIMMTSGKV